MIGAFWIALVLAGWSWFGVYMGALDTSSPMSVAALVAGNVVAGWFLYDTFFNDGDD